MLFRMKYNHYAKVNLLAIQITPVHFFYLTLRLLSSKQHQKQMTTIRNKNSLLVYTILPRLSVTPMLLLIMVKIVSQQHWMKLTNLLVVIRSQLTAPSHLQQNLNMCIILMQQLKQMLQHVPMLTHAYVSTKQINFIFLSLLILPPCLNVFFLFNFISFFVFQLLLVCLCVCSFV